jgi:mRNA-degrading endonuclease RelE of RelBE toxin-antitoxin system
MRYEFTFKFIKSYHSFPNNIQLKFDKQLGYLLKNIKHPSLHSKKFDEAEDIWQARVDQNIRFYFKINDDIYILLNIKNHPK